MIDKAAIARSGQIFEIGPGYYWGKVDVNITDLLKYLDKYNPGGSSVVETQTELGRTFSRGEPVTPDHPYVAYMVKYAGKSPDEAVRWAESKRPLFESKRLSGIVYPIEIAVHGNEVTGLHGTHRLGFSLALGLPTVPVRLVTLDRTLADLCEILFYIYDDPKHPYERIILYQPIHHPFFDLST